MPTVEFKYDLGEQVQVFASSRAACTNCEGVGHFPVFRREGAEFIMCGDWDCRTCHGSGQVAGTPVWMPGRIVGHFFMQDEGGPLGAPEYSVETSFITQGGYKEALLRPVGHPGGGGLTGV